MQIKDQVKQGVSSIVETVSSRYHSSIKINKIDTDLSDIANIGRPCAFPESIDPGQQMYKFFTSKMNIIDLIPCSYKINFNNPENGLKGYLPQINYETDYYNLCDYYGLPGVYGLRLYGTDDTMAADSFSNKTKPNFFQSGVNKASGAMQNFQDILSSLDSKASDDITTFASETINSFIPTVGNDKITGLLKNSVTLLADVVGAGHKISLPGIWSDSTFTPNFTTTLKLVSPYGHPSAVKEFIIKPLMYLLLLTTPGSNDGVSYGRPLFCTIQGYGLATIPLGQISDITLRRGGANSSFNIYRQPLTIDVNIQFSNLVEGFSHMNIDKATNVPADIYNNSDQFGDSIPTFDRISVNTIDSFMGSLYPRPGVARECDFKVSGTKSNFIASASNKNKEEPSSLANAPVTGTAEASVNISSQEQTSNIMDESQKTNTDPNMVFFV